jgi:hypothetical protein
VDWKNLYKRCATSREQLRGEEPLTQFGRMCAKLGIELIAASSPQAKGRVERVHGTHQDRLVKKLRRKQIDTHAQANVYLDAEYLPEHNRRFARAAARPEDYHRRAPRAAELDRIFRLESERTVSQDWVVRYENRFFQLERPSRHYAPAKGHVQVCEGRDGGLAIEYRGRVLAWREIQPPVGPSAPPARQAGDSRITPATAIPSLVKRKWVPPPDHPWRQAARRGDREASVERDGGDTAVVGLALRFALNTPPYGLRRASLRARPTTRTNQSKNKKRDISNEVRKRTFLKSFDRRAARR